MIYLDDRYEELEKIFKEKIEDIKKADYEELLKICEQENLEVDDNITEDELRQMLIDYCKEEIEE